MPALRILTLPRTAASGAGAGPLLAGPALARFLAAQATKRVRRTPSACGP